MAVAIVVHVTQGGFRGTAELNGILRRGCVAG